MSRIVPRTPATGRRAGTDDRAEITAWIDPADNVLQLDGVYAGAGRSIPRGSTTASLVDGVRVVLRRDVSQPAAYRVHTAYPQPQP